MAGAAWDQFLPAALHLTITPFEPNPRRTGSPMLCAMPPNLVVADGVGEPVPPVHPCFPVRLSAPLACIIHRPLPLTSSRPMALQNSMMTGTSPPRWDWATADGKPCGRPTATRRAARGRRGVQRRRRGASAPAAVMGGGRPRSQVPGLKCSALGVAQQRQGFCVEHMQVAGILRPPLGCPSPPPAPASTHLEQPAVGLQGAHPQLPRRVLRPAVGRRAAQCRRRREYQGQVLRKMRAEGQGQVAHGGQDLAGVGRRGGRRVFVMRRIKGRAVVTSTGRLERQAHGRGAPRDGDEGAGRN